MVNGFHRGPDHGKVSDMAKYMLLIYGDAEQWDAMTPEQAVAHDAAHRAFREAAGERVTGGGELDLSPTATTLRGDATGGLVTTDGPFLETKEALGGYYLLDADDLDEVVEAGVAAARGASRAQRRRDPADGRPRMTEAVVAAVAEAHRRDWAQVLATTAQVTGDLDLAEECTQDAYAQALVDLAGQRHSGPARRLAHPGRPQQGQRRPAPAVGVPAAAAAAGHRRGRATGRRRGWTTTGSG